jgi:hypothetical protein
MSFMRPQSHCQLFCFYAHFCVMVLCGCIMKADHPQTVVATVASVEVPHVIFCHPFCTNPARCFSAPMLTLRLSWPTVARLRLLPLRSTTPPFSYRTRFVLVSALLVLRDIQTRIAGAMAAEAHGSDDRKR